MLFLHSIQPANPAHCRRPSCCLSHQRAVPMVRSKQRRPRREAQASTGAISLCFQFVVRLELSVTSHGKLYQITRSCCRKMTTCQRNTRRGKLGRVAMGICSGFSSPPHHNFDKLEFFVGGAFSVVRCLLVFRAHCVQQQKILCFSLP